jgi:hypothetical protein
MPTLAEFACQSLCSRMARILSVFLCLAGSATAEITDGKVATFIEKYLQGNVPGNDYLSMYTDTACFGAKDLLFEVWQGSAVR